MNAALPAATSAPEPPPVVPSLAAPLDAPLVSPLDAPLVLAASSPSPPPVDAVPSPCAGFTVCALVPWPIVISPEIVVSATFDSKQPVATRATAERTRSSGKQSAGAHAE